MNPYFYYYLLFILSVATINAEKFTQFYRKRMHTLAYAAQHLSSSHTPSERSGNITTIVDVGANRGDWTKLMKDIFPHAQYFMIEANPKLEPYLKAVGSPYEIHIVGDETKLITFHVHKHYDTGGSVFREKSYDNMASRSITSIQREMDTIDNILERRGVRNVDMLKMDIQGAEFIALRGAEKTLRGVKLVCLEASIHQYNPGAATFTDINLLLESQGFRLYDIIDLRYDPHLYGARSRDNQYLLQVDFLWARADSDFFTATPYPPPPAARFSSTLQSVTDPLK
mmetsp:Transcript_23828/g.34944  ORF Transcript_23828/g.34944 Transcript_23828/m.34944 type:complete len:284 (-) Transcript_23828:181-1032(-)